MTAFERKIKKYLKAPLLPFFAVVRPGFESIAQNEILEILPNTETSLCEGGVEFFAKLESVWLLHLKSRTLTSVRLRIKKIRAGTIGEFSSKIKEIPWELYLPHSLPTSFLVVDSKLSNCRIPEALLLENILNREIIKTLATKTNSQTMTHEQIQKLYIRGENNQYQISIDCSGSNFYKHGYRKAINHAPIRETTAALMLKSASVASYRRIFDPMCGSGTFTLEAIANALELAPGIARTFPFHEWPSFRKSTFDYLAKKCTPKVPSMAQEFYPSDLDPKAVNATAINLKELQNKMPSTISLSSPTPTIQDCFDPNYWKNQKLDADSLILLNPPYGKRISTNTQQFSQLGTMIATSFSPARVALITPGKEEEKALLSNTNGITHQKIVFFNGSIKCAFFIFR